MGPSGVGPSAASWARACCSAASDGSHGRGRASNTGRSSSADAILIQPRQTPPHASNRGRCDSIRSQGLISTASKTDRVTRDDSMHALSPPPGHRSVPSVVLSVTARKHRYYNFTAGRWGCYAPYHIILFAVLGHLGKDVPAYEKCSAITGRTRSVVRH